MGCDAKLSVCWDEPLEVALEALSTGMVTLAELRAAASVRRKQRPVIGKLALESRRLNVSQVFRVLERQCVTGELFGEAALQLNYLEESELHELLRLQMEQTQSLSEVLLREKVLSDEQVEFLHRRIRDRLHCETHSSHATSAG